MPLNDLNSFMVNYNPDPTSKIQDQKPNIKKIQHQKSMNIEQLRQYCLDKKGVTEDFPFDEHTLCIRVGKKIFAIVGLDAVELRVNLKCDPDRAIEWREQYPEVQPGWHMNKAHWNTVDFEGGLDARTLREMIDHSYEMVFKSLKKADQAAINAL